MLILTQINEKFKYETESGGGFLYIFRFRVLIFLQSLLS
jgi:hypothetical protein